jgi:hypothetical protein
MPDIHTEILDYIAELIKGIKEDILSERYSEAREKVDEVATLISSLDEHKVSK